MTLFTVGIITVSDTASVDATKDKSGPLLQTILTTPPSSTTNVTLPYNVIKTTIVPDDANKIKTVVLDWVNNEGLDLLLLTGGTGFAERDVTPDTIEPLLTRHAPGLTHLMISTSLSKTPFAALSRPVSGFIKKTLVLTLPGSPKACRENMDALLPIMPHALQLVRGQIDQVQKTHTKLASDKVPHQHQPHQHTCLHHHHSQHDSQSHRALNLNTPVAKRSRVSPYPMIPVDDAYSIIRRYAAPVGTICLPLSEDLIGYVLAEDVYAKESVPGYRASVVDGYAVYAEDGPGIYPVSHVSLASSHYQAESGSTDTHYKLQRKHIARVATGGLVPDGANAVVMVEDTRLVDMAQDNKEESTVEILQPISAGAMIRPIGSDCRQGDLVCTKGTLFSTVGGELGVLASVGVTSVVVYRKPRLGILSTGNEVQDISMTSRPLAPGEIRDSNRLTLLAAARQAGFDAVDLGIVDDRVDDIQTCLEKALIDLDMIITTGGVSMGEADYIKPLLEQKFNATIHFGRVNMKPGKPTTFATIPFDHLTTTTTTQSNKEGTNDKLVFALPGNPVSATVTFYLFVLPALKQMSGVGQPGNVKIPVKISHDIYLDTRPEYHRVRVYINSSTGHLEATSTGEKQQSSRMGSMIAANGLLELPVKTNDASMVLKGDHVQCLLLGSLYQL
ncbi:hypothetical protein BC941DRAFT_411547 [Chlamydoabsidia padenii]|nr:hypothetical protein BC941DRAFT_411547 [Chlamydoabsidia padenii]